MAGSRPSTKHDIVRRPKSKRSGRTYPRVGRPRLLEADLDKVDHLLAAIGAGAPAVTACAIAGIVPSLYYLWLQKAEQGAGEPYQSFSDSVKRMNAERELSWIRDIERATAWQSKAWLLERRFPERWAKQERVEARVDHAGGVTASFDINAALHALGYGPMGSLTGYPEVEGENGAGETGSDKEDVV